MSDPEDWGTCDICDAEYLVYETGERCGRCGMCANCCPHNGWTVELVGDYFVMTVSADGLDEFGAIEQALALLSINYGWDVRAVLTDSTATKKEIP